MATYFECCDKIKETHSSAAAMLKVFLALAFVTLASCFNCGEKNCPNDNFFFIYSCLWLEGKICSKELTTNGTIVISAVGIGLALVIVNVVLFVVFCCCRRRSEYVPVPTE